jgi:biotin carboxyl carrier protein
MRYYASLPGQKEPKPLELLPLGGNRYAITVDGVRHEVDASHPEPGVLSLLIDGESYAIDLEDSGELVKVRVRDEVFSVDVADERKLRMRAATHAPSLEGRQQLRAPMPGKVVKLLVKPGDAVSQGQGMVVVEAMKMENELKSPKAGTVLEVNVKEGQAVESGAPLAVVE